MKQITHLIGDQEGSPEVASDENVTTSYGWRELGPYSSHSEMEWGIIDSLESDLNISTVRHAGNRNQSYDIEILDDDASDVLAPGLYEVKSLWRRNDTSRFDRRFKVGTRGEEIYGRRDSQIKSFALAFEDELIELMEGNVRNGIDTINNVKFVEKSFAFIDDALGRKHSKCFEAKLNRVASAAIHLPSLRTQAEDIISGGIGPADIVRGFRNIQGVFVVAGHKYTLVTQAEMASMFAFDSASSEGPKLRMLGVIPSEQDTRVKKKNKNEQSRCDQAKAKGTWRR